MIKNDWTVRNALKLLNKNPNALRGLTWFQRTLIYAELYRRAARNKELGIEAVPAARFVSENMFEMVYMRARINPALLLEGDKPLAEAARIVASRPEGSGSLRRATHAGAGPLRFMAPLDASIRKGP